MMASWKGKGQKRIDCGRCRVLYKDMKKLFVLMILVMIAVSALCASGSEQENAQDIKKFQLQNTFIGWGVGSRHQGDLQTAKKLLALDISGTALAVTGGISLAASIVMYNGYRAMVGEVTKADIYISAGILGAGIITLIVSKAMGLQAPARF